jgi:hypothetical protein
MTDVEMQKTLFDLEIKFQKLQILSAEVKELRARVAKLEGLKDVFDPDHGSIGPNVPPLPG